MIDPYLEAMATILANPASKAGLVELGRTGRVRAMGRRITFRLTEGEDGSRRYVPETAATSELIPPEDFTGASIREFPDGLRLEVSRVFFGRESLSVLKAWDEVVFDLYDLRNFYQETQARAAATMTRRRPRRDARRSEIHMAVVALRDMEDWRAASDKIRCRLVEQHLGKPGGWCTPSTLRRAMQDAESAPLSPLA
jgi:hypothetical protein